MDALHVMMQAAQDEWIEGFVTGPTEPLGPVLAPGRQAPSFTLPDETGRPMELSDFWSNGRALVMFWRHFGCGCGIDRARRLTDEAASYASAGLNPVIIGQGEPERAAQFKERHGIRYPILSDPDHEVYRAYGVGHYALEQIFYDDAADAFAHTREIGLEFRAGRPEGRELVDDPWRASAEFVIGPTGTIRLAHAYQWCEDYPHPGVLTSAAALAT